ncbi:MAG: thiamine/thiamine pyrophosphate ABC transporter, permease protein [Rhizobiales bacterium]|nr:thiamine/thiamine pyrophosphate ABC transporter, permease protein [Hyphomicrobiales bacterium]
MNRESIFAFGGGGLSLAIIWTVIAGAFAALVMTAAGGEGPSATLSDPYLWRVVRFTLWQAALSTILSVGFAVPVARAFARRRGFAGRRVLLALFALPLALPALVVVLGVVEVWGRTGWFNGLAEVAGFEPALNVYGLSGILLAHVFFNLPLATRLLLAHLDRVPAENWRLASQLDMPATAVWRFIEWPVLKAALPGAASLVFMLCVTSFTVVLTLGGGPRATTIEVAIYQALRFDFDPVRAVTLALLQLVLCGVLVISAGRITGDMQAQPSLGKRAARADLDGWIGDAVVIGLAGLFVLLPLVAIVTSAVRSDLARLAVETAMWQAIFTSTWVALSAAALCLILTAGLLSAVRASQRRHAGKPFFEWNTDVAGSLILVMPPIVLGAGWFVLLRGVGDIFTLAPLVVIIVNALMALPFVLRVLGPAVAQANLDHGRLCASLDLAGWNRLRLVDWPVLQRPLALALAFAMALSIGDLGVIALFGSEDFTTLPFLLYQRFGTYRIDDAAGLALILTVYCLGLIALADRVRGERRKVTG